MYNGAVPVSVSSRLCSGKHAPRSKAHRSGPHSSGLLYSGQRRSGLLRFGLLRPKASKLRLDIH
jgi:hypothetical protein